MGNPYNKRGLRGILALPGLNLEARSQFFLTVLIPFGVLCLLWALIKTLIVPSTGSILKCPSDDSFGELCKKLCRRPNIFVANNLSLKFGFWVQPPLS